MSRNYTIFPPQNPRIDPQGRSANLAGTASIFKKTSTTTIHAASDPYERSPFSGYTCKIGDGNGLETQSSLSEESMSAEAIRQIVREEVARMKPSEDGSRKLMQTFQAQIADLKDRIAEYEKSNNQKLQECSMVLNENIRVEAQKMGKEIDSEITLKLRSFFQKATVEVKKDILKAVDDHYLNSQDFDAHLDDLNERIAALTETIKSLQLAPSPTSTPTPKQPSPAQPDDAHELRLAKLEREAETTRKLVGEWAGKTKRVEDAVAEDAWGKGVRGVEEAQEHLKEKVRQMEQDSLALLKRVGNSQIRQSGMEGDLLLLKARTSDIQSEHDEQKLILIDLSKKLGSRDSADSEVKQFLRGSEGEETSLFLNDSAVGGAAERGEGGQGGRAGVYQVDKEGYLMDGEGRYLLKANDEMIKLTSHQINVLITSNVVQIIDS